MAHSASNDALAARARDLKTRYGSLQGEALLRPLIEKELHGRVALTSSFGAESAVLLHMVACIDQKCADYFSGHGKII